MVSILTFNWSSATFYNLSEYESGRHKKIKEKTIQISIQGLTDPLKDIDLKTQWDLLMSPLPFIIFPVISLADIKGSRRNPISNFNLSKEKVDRPL